MDGSVTEAGLPPQRGKSNRIEYLEVMAQSWTMEGCLKWTGMFCTFKLPSLSVQL
jgi:hypothetical protein